MVGDHAIEISERVHDTIPTPQGMAGLIISMTSFGLSKTFTGLVVRYSRNPFRVGPKLISRLADALPVY